MRLLFRLILWSVALLGLLAILFFVPSTFWIKHATAIQVSTIGSRIDNAQIPSGFPIKPYGSYQTITRSTRIDGQGAHTVSESLLAAIDPTSGGSACHMPVYGLRFYLGPICTFETTVCFHCNNIYVRRLLEYYWQGLSEKQQILKADLEAILPLQNTEQGAAANP